MVTKSKLNKKVMLVNSSPPSVTYVHQWTEPYVVQVMACRLFGAKPIPEPNWSNPGLLLIGLLGTNFSEIWIGILSFSFNKMHLKMLSAKMSAIFSRGRWVKNYFSNAECCVWLIMNWYWWLDHGEKNTMQDIFNLLLSSDIMWKNKDFFFVTNI